MRRSDWVALIVCVILTAATAVWMLLMGLGYI